MCVCEPSWGSATRFMPDTIEDEFSGAELGDVRRNRRLGRVASGMAEAPAASVSGACGGWAESMAAFRLLNAPEVTPKAILAPHQGAILARAAASPCVLVIQDTTELDFSTMKTMEGCGPLNEETRRGFFMHSLYVLSEPRSEERRVGEECGDRGAGVH